MTEEIVIKPKTDNEKIISLKGNNKCLFYSDDICRKGDKTRDCLNCARVEYQSLYNLNWDNQEKLHKEIDRLEQENEQLSDNYDKACMRIELLTTENKELYQTLITINEILYNRPEYCKSCEAFKNGACMGLSLENCEYDFHQKILNLISEVIK